MYSYLLNMWKMCKISEVNVENAVTQNRITRAQGDEIIATPRNCS